MRKCQGAGYAKVALCCNDKRKLGQISEAVQCELSASEQSKVMLISPEQIASIFSTAEAQQQAASTMKGYRVKVKYDDAANDPTKEDIIKRIIGRKK